MLRRISGVLRGPPVPLTDASLIPTTWKATTTQSASAAAPIAHIQRSFVFKDFHVAWAFMSSCVAFINAQDHHPEWFNVYNRVDVKLTTHDCKGVSVKDVALAKHMDAMALEAAASSHNASHR